MGLYYQLSNGESIEIRIEENENFEQEAHILLFNGSTTLIYPLSKYKMLNDIIEEVEKDYNNLLQKDLDFEYKCWCD